MNEKIIVFAPHPDDETLGCGGTIAKRIDEGYEVIIVIMTDGRHSYLEMLGITKDPTPNELKEIRKEELKKATRILGVPEENLIFLDFIDGTLMSNMNELDEKITEILSKIRPVEVYFPYKSDYHPDHRAACQTIKNSIKKLGIFPIKYQYSITRKYARIGPILDKLYSLFNHHIVSINISKYLPLKKEAINEFKSEIMTISGRKNISITGDISKFMNNNEYFYIDK